MDVEVTASGPLFDGRAVRLMDDAQDRAVEDLADASVMAVRAELGRRARHETGHAASRVTAEPRGDGFRVTMPGVVYENWLVGRSRRNAVSTFKGWDLFGAAEREVEQHADQIIAKPIDAAIEAINR